MDQVCCDLHRYVNARASLVSRTAQYGVLLQFQVRWLLEHLQQFDEEGKPYLTKQDVIDVKKVWALRLPALGIKQKL